MDSTARAKTVAIIDEDPLLTEILKERLELEGTQVMVAKNGIEGLQLVLQSQPDLVVTNIHIPATDGVTMIANLRQNNWMGNVMVITDVTDSQAVNQCLQMGVADFLVRYSWKLEDVVDKIKLRLSSN